MYRVLDVCRFVINYSNEKDYGVSNLKLQKLLYFIQVYFLVKGKKPCFIEKIEAWDFGPVVPVAYHEFKQYGSTDIPPVNKFRYVDEEATWDSSVHEYDDNHIDDDDKKLIKLVVDKLSGYSATDLVKITHLQAPWKNAYVPYKNNDITIEAMRSYFNEE